METEPAQRRFRGRVWWNAGGAGGDGAAAGKVQTPGTDGAGRVKADKGRGRGRGKGKKAGGSVVPPLGSSGGVAAGRMEFGVWRCPARLPNVLGSFLKCSMTACMLVAGSS